MSIARDLRLARAINKHGGRYGLRIVWESRRAGIPVSLGCALINQESGFRNIFGSDPVDHQYSTKGNYAHPLTVTRARYKGYLKARKAGKGMQGVGPSQLTWYGYQDYADQIGGCWKPKYNIRAGFKLVKDKIDQYGLKFGLAAYNGSGAAANRYSESVLDYKAKWHRILSKVK
jgi:hypothetical protein